MTAGASRLKRLPGEMPPKNNTVSRTDKSLLILISSPPGGQVITTAFPFESSRLTFEGGELWERARKVFDNGK